MKKEEIAKLHDKGNQLDILTMYYQNPELITKYPLEEKYMADSTRKQLLRAFHICAQRGYKVIDPKDFYNILQNSLQLSTKELEVAWKMINDKYHSEPVNIEACYEIERKNNVLIELVKAGINISHFYADNSLFAEDPDYLENYEKASAEDIRNYYINQAKNIKLPANKNSISLVPKRISELERVNEPIEYLIDGWMKKDSFNSIIGAAKAGKTQLTMQMAFCVQNGIPFMGYECKKADVLYVDFELEHNEIGKRINLLKQYYEMPEAESYYYISASRDFANGTIKMDNILEAVREAKKNNPNIKLCIFDCYYTFAEGDSNTEIDTRKNLQPLKGLVDDMCVCYVHHTNKASGDITNLIYAAGGSGVHGKIVDSTYVVWPKSSKDDTFYIATTGRSGGGKKIVCKKNESTFHQFKPVEDADERHTLGGKTVDKNPKEEQPDIWAAVGINGTDLRKIKSMFNVTSDELKEMGFNVDGKKKKIFRV